MRQQRRTRRREAHRPAVTIEQFHLEVPLERLDLLRQRWPGDAQPFGRPPEIQLIGNRDEVPKLPQLHADSVVGIASQQEANKSRGGGIYAAGLRL